MQSEVIVLPSRVEWYSYAYLECAAAKLKTILKDRTGSAEMARVLGDQNAVITNGSEEEIAAAIRTAPYRPVCTTLNDNQIEKLLPRNTARERLRVLRNFKPGRSNEYPNVSILKPCAKGTNTTLLSVVIPYFNSALTLEDTLTSLERERSFIGEIIIVNDGSNYANRCAVQELGARFGASVFHQENKGLPAARNAGLNQSKYDCVLFLDSDDLISNDYLKKSLKLIGRYSNIGGVGAWVNTFGIVQNLWETFDGKYTAELL
jgi:hypothetical protein